MNKQSDLMKIVCNEITKDKQPIFNRLVATKTYDTSAIYDHPHSYITVRGMFRYCNVDVIA